MRRVAVLWVVLFWLWLLLVGQWDREQWIAAAVAAAVTAPLGETALRRARAWPRVPPGRIATAWTVPAMVVVDFAIVMRALVRRERGVFVRRTVRADLSHPAVRAWLALAATYSPNAYVVDVDGEAGVVLLHDLVRHRSSESPV